MYIIIKLSINLCGNMYCTIQCDSVEVTSCETALHTVVLLSATQWQWHPPTTPYLVAMASTYYTILGGNGIHLLHHSPYLVAMASTYPALTEATWVATTVIFGERVGNMYCFRVTIIYKWCPLD